MLECDVCGKEWANRYKLNRHKVIHDKNAVKYECDIDGCNFSCNDKYNLKKHKTHKHDIDVQWYKCEVDGCDLKFKASADLKRHFNNIHNKNAPKFKCTINKCKRSFKYEPNLKRHIQTFHNMSTIKHPCSDCDHIAKSKTDLKRHFDRLHNTAIPDISCDLPKCNYKTKMKVDLDKHKYHIHNINVKWFPCDIEACRYQAKRIHLLREHKGYLHDIGKQICPFCKGNRYKLIPYKKDDDSQTFHICRTCYYRKTHPETRVELAMSRYLDEQFGTDYLLCSDSRIYGDVCSRYRPDKLYGDPMFVLHIECDEQQHSHSNGSYSCDEQRISAIYNEFVGKKYVIIRWNPDKYKVPEGKKKFSTRGEKLELLLACMGQVIQKPPEELIKIIYMFYDEDNELISRNIPHTLVYDTADLKKI